MSNENAKLLTMADMNRVRTYPYDQIRATVAALEEARRERDHLQLVVQLCREQGVAVTEIGPLDTGVFNARASAAEARAERLAGALRELSEKILNKRTPHYQGGGTAIEAKNAAYETAAYMVRAALTEEAEKPK